MGRLSRVMGGRDWGGRVKGKGRMFFTKEGGVYGAGAGPYGCKDFVGTGVLRQEQRERRPRRGAGLGAVT